MADVLPPDKMTETRAEIRLPTEELRDDLAFFTKVLKMRLDMIYPADNPEVAVLSGHGLRLRIEKGAAEPAGTIRILTEDPDGFAGGQRLLTAPNGTRVEIDELNPPLVLPASIAAAAERRPPRWTISSLRPTAANWPPPRATPLRPGRNTANSRPAPAKPN